MEKYANLMIALGVAVLTGCAGNEDLPVQKTTQKNIVVEAGVKTRAGFDNSNLPDSFALFITQDAADATSSYNYSSVAMKAPTTGDAWTVGNTNDTLIWKNDAPKATVIAYTLTDNETLTYGTALASGTVKVQTDQTTDANIKKSDFLYYKATNVDPETGGKLPIAFNHKFAKLKFTWTYANELEGTINIGKLYFNTALPLEAVVDYVNDAALTASTTVTGNISAYIDNTNKTAEAVIIPDGTTDTFNVTFTVNVNGTDRTFPCTITLASAPAVGSQQNISVIIGRDKVVMGNVTATAWVEQTAVNGETL